MRERFFLRRVLAVDRGIEKSRGQVVMGGQGGTWVRPVKTKEYVTNASWRD